MAELGSHDTRHPWSLLQEPLSREGLGKQLALVGRCLKGAGAQEKQGTGLEKEPQEGQKETGTAPAPLLLLLPGLPDESPAASAAWAGSPLLGHWS